jgi:hypothetical protein
MTITFEHDNDVIVYALEMIISYPKRTQQIFMAQCIWWLASVLRLESDFVDHIDKLHGRVVVKEPIDSQVDPSASRDIEEDPQLSRKENWIHPERRSQTNLDICDLDLNDTIKEPRPEVIEPIKSFLARSRKERKAFNKQKKDQLSQTRSGKIRAQPVTAG